jgi:hypothetical protein
VHTNEYGQQQQQQQQSAVAAAATFPQIEHNE